MKRIISVIFILTLPCMAIGKTGIVKYTVLTGQAAKAISNQCSRENPPEFSEIWVPDEKSIANLEAKLTEIEALTPKLCCLEGVHISNIHKYFRQYVGIVSKGGRHLIYINAFLGSTPPKKWLTEPVIACDGGLSFWGAIFDPETGEFSQLAINGVS